MNGKTNTTKRINIEYVAAINTLLNWTLKAIVNKIIVHNINIPSNDKNRYAKYSFTKNGDGLEENKLSPKTAISKGNNKSKLNTIGKNE